MFVVVWGVYFKCYRKFFDISIWQRKQFNLHNAYEWKSIQSPYKSTNNEWNTFLMHERIIIFSFFCEFVFVRLFAKFYWDWVSIWVLNVEQQFSMQCVFDTVFNSLFTHTHAYKYTQRNVLDDQHAPRFMSICRAHSLTEFNCMSPLQNRTYIYSLSGLILWYFKWKFACFVYDFVVFFSFFFRLLLSINIGLSHTWIHSSDLFS